jgi:hypothetical protein
VRINLPHINFHIDGVLHGGVLELTGVGFEDDVGKAATTPSDVSVLLLCPCYWGVVSGAMVVMGGFLQEPYPASATCGCGGAGVQ